MTLQQIQQLQQALETLEKVTGYSPKYILWLLEQDTDILTDTERQSILDALMG